MQRKPDLDEVILQIHAAPLSPEGWNAVSRSLVTLCEADRSAMLRVGPSPASAPVMTATTLDPETVTEYFNTWASHDVLYHGALRHGRLMPALVSTDEQVVERRAYFSSSYYNEYLRRHDIESQLNVCLTGPDSGLNLGPSAMTLYRGVASEPFSKDTADTLQRLAPHLSLAARATWHIEALTLAQPMYRQALDEIRIPFFALDANGKLALTNSAGDTILRAERWIRVKGGCLGASPRLLNADDFRAALVKLRHAEGATVLLTEADAQERAVMTTVPLADSSSVRMAGRRITGFLWIMPCAEQPTPVDKLGKLFDLTRAEIRLFQRLVDGESLRDAAAHLRISDNTARSQLKAVFRKTGRRTQGQLLTLAHRMAAIRMKE